MENSKSWRKKWSGEQVKARHDRAARLRAARKHTSPARRRVRELAVIREIIGSSSLEHEPRAISSSWPTYAYRSALECTELFCELYLDAYRRHYGKSRDYLAAARQLPVSTDLFQNDSRQINSLWRARQVADQLGMPYEVFLDATMGWATGQKNRRQLLAPNQLYGEEALAAAKKHWSETQDTFSIFTDDWDPRLFVGDEKSGRPRIKAMRLLHRRITTAKHPEIALANYMGRRGAIDETLARRMFHKRAGLVDDALRCLSGPLPPLRRAPARIHVPGCFGLQVHARDPVCNDCPLVTQCARLWEAATAELKHVIGSADPLADKKRQQNTERKRRQRERERAAAWATDTP